MLKIHVLIRAFFRRWGRFVFLYPWWIVGTAVALTAVLFSGLSLVKMAASTESYISENDASREVYDRFRNQFGYDENILLLLRTENVFDLAFLEKFRAFHRDLEENLPSLDEVNSLINARVTRAEGDELIVKDLFEDWPTTPEELAEIRERALSSPTYVNTIISEDGKVLAIPIRLMPGSWHPQSEGADSLDAALADRATSTGEISSASRKAKTIDNEELYHLVETLHEIVARHQAEDFPIYITGGPPMTHAILEVMRKNMAIFTLLSDVFIGIVLFLMFRRLSGVFLPVLVVTTSLIATFGIMGYLGIVVTPTTQIMPTLILAACVGDSIHLLSIFYQQYDRGKSKEEAMVYALGYAGLPMIMTSLTTAGGLFSFFVSDLVPLKGLGIAAPTGVILAWVYSVFFLPAVVAICPVRPRKISAGPTLEHGGHMERSVVSLGDFSVRRPWLIVAVWTVLTLVGAYGAVHIRFSHAPQKWFPKDDPLRANLQMANEKMKGVFSLELMLDTGRENGLYDPEVMNRLQKVHDITQGQTFNKITIGKTVSVLDVLRETNQALHEGNPTHYSVPQDRDVIAQEFFLFENAGSDDLEQLVDSQFRVARVSLLLPFDDAIYFLGAERAIHNQVQEAMGDHAKVESTGLIMLYARTIAMILKSTAESYGIAFLVIAFLMVLLVGSFRMGMLSLIPNAVPIILGIGLMHWAKIPLDMFTILIGSVACGVVVDDTIHFLHQFRDFYVKHGNVKEAVHATLEQTGVALVINAVVLIISFFVFLLSPLNNVKSFGLITGWTLFFGLAADLTLAPAIVELADRVRSLKTEFTADQEEAEATPQ